MTDTTTVEPYLSDAKVEAILHDRNLDYRFSHRMVARTVIDFYEPAYQRLLAENAALTERLSLIDEQEPSAWMYKGGDSKYPVYLTLDKEIAEDDCTEPLSIKPLYLRPSLPYLTRQLTPDR